MWEISTYLTALTALGESVLDALSFISEAWWVACRLSWGLACCICIALGRGHSWSVALELEFICIHAHLMAAVEEARATWGSRLNEGVTGLRALEILRLSLVQIVLGREYISRAGRSIEWRIVHHVSVSSAHLLERSSGGLLVERLMVLELSVADGLELHASSTIHHRWHLIEVSLLVLLLLHLVRVCEAVAVWPILLVLLRVRVVASCAHMR